MTKRSTEYYLLQGIVVVSIALIVLISYAITDALRESKSINEEDTKYVSYEVLTDNVMPVVKEDEQVVNIQEEITNPQEKTTDQQGKNDLVKPYKDDSVVIGKSYYDYQAEESNQQNSIIYYENTYIQNTGVDYIGKKVFAVNAIADGKVLKITKDDILGTTIKVEHANNLIAIYQSVNEVKVKENEQVVKGQEIATSGTNSIGSDLGNHLHFELYKDNILVNPETFFNNKEG